MQFSVVILARSKTFLGVLTLFALANLWTWLRHKISPLCCDQKMTIGFPVPFHISDGIAGLQDVYILGLLLDISIAATVAITATWIVRLFRH
jgi:hypothetical protein